MKKSKGYIILTSAIILAVIFMMIAFALGSYSFYSRSNISTTEFKKNSQSLAESCAEIALLKFKLLNTYAGNETIPIDSNSCSILPFESGVGQKIIKVTATIKNTTSNFKITISYPVVTIISWEELASF
jgi:hypothetical protein